MNAAGEDGRTPLFTASENGYTNTVKALIAVGADVNAADKHGWTPLRIASLKRHTDIVLIATGADVNAAIKLGWSPLRIAYFNNTEAVVDLLQVAGARL